MLSRRSFMKLAGLGGAAFALPRCGTGLGPEPLPDDPSKPWWLRRNFAPITESMTTEMEIRGSLPRELSGVYLRNGPNPLRSGSSHWFLGDGMMHGTRISRGKALWYRARYIQTEVRGDSSSGLPLLGHHQANTSVLNHAGRVFCLEEVGLPYEISPEDLSTIGTYDFEGALDTAMTAHPKVDPITGELLFFAYGSLGPVLTYHRADPNGLLVQSERIHLPAPVMMHDFQITPSHVVFMDLPIVVDPAAAGDVGLPYRWTPENGARLGIMPRTGSEADLVWIPIDPCFVFHTWNAFHDRARQDVIHLDGIRYEKIWERDSNDFNTSGRPHRFSIDLTARSVSLAQLDDRMVELPRIDSRKQGSEYRYGYGVSSDAPLGADGGLPPFDRIVKIDHSSGVRTAHELDPGQEADEAMFVPHPSATAEDDGWLLSYVFDASDNRSHLRVIDASDLEAPPIARVMLPHRVPHGFHGEFIWDA